VELKKTVKLRLHKGNYGRTVIYSITLPKEFVEALGWKKGDMLEVVLDTEKKIILVRAKR